ncbi:MAG: polysaccharide lyase family 1 protein [Clostridia bacterium]
MKKIVAALLAASFAIAGTGAFAAENESARENNAAGGGKYIPKAFPTAEGGGMYTSGARGALEDNKDIEVYHVTNLNDSGEGSFRDAVSKGNRIIVFDVSGMIDLQSKVSIGKDNITILGQTAPGDGICFRGNSVKINGSNIILRYLRFRVGSKLADGSDTETQDGFGIPIGAENVIMDHCSVSWGTDENLSVIGTENVTVQWSIISEALNSSIHAKGEHSYAGIWGGVNTSFHHNIIASHKSRNPKIGTSETVSMTPGYTDDKTVVDMWNNVIYNWGDKAGYGAENGANVNIVNNYYKAGPATPSGKRARIFELSPGNKYQPKWSGDIYANGNYIDDDSTNADDIANAAAVNEENWQIEKKTGVYLDADGITTYNKLDSLRESSYLYNNSEIQTAQEAYEDVIADAGARLPKRDLVDSRIIENVTNRTAPAQGSNGSVYLLDDPVDGIPEGQEDLYDNRGYPIWVSESRAADYDTDGDGIADEWEDKMGLNKENPTDSLNIGPDGYTYLEIFAEDGITHTSGDISLTVEDYTATVSSQTAGEVDIYVDDKKVQTVELTGNIPEGSTLISAAYDNGMLTEVKSSVYNGGAVEYPSVEGVNVKHFIWDSLEGMKPVNVSGGSATVNIGASDIGVHTVTAVSADKSRYSNMEYLYAEGPVSEPAHMNGDFTAVLYAGKVSTVAKNAYGMLSIGDDSGEGCWVGIGTNSKYEKVLYNNGQELPLEDTTMVKMVREGSKISLYRGSSPLNMTFVAEYPFTSGEAVIYFSDVCTQEEKSVTSASCRIITETTQPRIEIINIEENQRLGFNENIEVNVIPDKASVNQISVSLNGEVIAEKAVDISEAGAVSVPVEFSGINAGLLEVSCVDSNLCVASDSVNVTVSADLTPWQIADIGIDDGSAKTYVSATNDYTYKISAPGGNIGGTSDAFGYVYQKFTGDNRIYYRSRMQSGEQFGIMLRKSLEPDSEAYFFGGEYDNGALVYSLKSRDTNGGGMTSVATNGLSGANLYFIAEKAGNKLNIYQTENGSTIYTTKKLLHSIDVSALGDEYYMGFASVYGKSDGNPPDAGWLGIDNSSGSSYKWNFDYGLDWCWQMQEANVLSPSWTTETIGTNESGKMVLAPDDNYSGERYVFREYIMDDEYVPEMSADVMLTGDDPAMNVYLQAGNADKAYKITFDSDKKIKDANGNEIGEWSSNGFYHITMTVDVDEATMDNICEVNIMSSSADGAFAVQQYDAAIPVDSNFRTQINTEKKTPVKKAVYFEPVSGVSGTYYIDNVSVVGSEPSVIVEKTERFLNFEDQTVGTNTTEYTSGGFTVLSEMPITESKKTIDGVSFTKRIQMDKGSASSKAISFDVSGPAKIQIYAAQGGTSGTRNAILDNGSQQLKTVIGDMNVFTTDYSGDAGTIRLYSDSKIYIYGIKVIETKITSKK